MEAWKTILLTSILSIITAIITTRVTAWCSHKNEVKKWLLEKRADIYFSFYNQVELALKEREKVFRKEYLYSLIDLKPQMKLISSEKTFNAFRSYYEFIENIVNEYESFCNKNDPEKNKDLVTPWDIDMYEWQVGNYEQEHLPNNQIMNIYIEPLYKAMRDDLGSNI